MTVSPRCRPGHDQLRPVQRRRRQDESPEAVLLSLAAEIRSLSAERPFSEELLLMEQVFVLLLDGFRRQALPDGRVGLLPPLAAVAAPAGDQPLAIPAPAQLGVIAALLKAGMDWVELDGQAALLCFPARLLAT
jgi:hypothetical protein